MHLRIIYYCILLVSLTVSACSGGGGNKEQPIQQNLPPTVDAGNDQTAPPSATVNLSATASDSDGTVVSYSWSQTAGDTVSLSSPDSSSTSFAMPSNPTATAFSFTVAVTDNDGASSSDTVTVTVHRPPTVDAGNNQTVLISSTVNLNGTATPSTGTIISYSWRQTSGEAVSLSDPNSATPSFTAPSTAGNIELTLTAVDSFGTQAEDSVAIKIVNSLTNVTGKVTFDLVPFNTNTNGLDYNNTRVSPARGVLVETIDAQGNQIAATVTDGKGNYVLSPSPNTEMRIRISAHMKQTTGAKWDVKVTDNTNNNALYVTQGELFNSSSNASERNFHLASGWDGAGYSQTRAAATFAILDAIYETVQKFALVDPSIVLPPLEVRWSPKNSTADGNLAEGDIGSSFYDPNQGIIYLLGREENDTDEYDRHVIIHEWGHFLEHKLSRSDSIGGRHESGDRLDIRVALSEGLANALSAIVTDDAFYRDSSDKQQASGFSMDINNNSTQNPGWFNEESVQSIIYDISDDDNELDDNLALGLDPIYSVLTDTNYRNQPYFTSIYSFTNRLKIQQPSSANAIDSLLNAQQIFGSGDNGVNETNDGDISSALPVYKTATIGGNAIQVCSVNNAGTPNKLGNTAFVTFEVTASGFYTFTVTETGGATQSDPDLKLFRAGNYIARVATKNKGKETSKIYLGEIGIYQMEIYAWNNMNENVTVDDDDNLIPGNYCFDLQITN
jgi:hypothetical protein